MHAGMSSNKTISRIFQSLSSAIKIQPKRPPLGETDWLHLNSVPNTPPSREANPPTVSEDESRSDDDDTAELLEEIATSLCDNFESSVEDYGQPHAAAVSLLPVTSVLEPLATTLSFNVDYYRLFFVES